MMQRAINGNSPNNKYLDRSVGAIGDHISGNRKLNNSQLETGPVNDEDAETVKHRLDTIKHRADHRARAHHESLLY